LQHGHRSRLLASVTVRRRRIVAIELGIGRSGRIGGASGSVTIGKGRFLEVRGGTRSRGGKRLPLGDQEAASGDAQCGVVGEASPTSPLIMAKSEFLLKLLIVAFDAPAPPGLDPGVGEVDQ